MADRLAKVRRIQAVQAELHRLAEWRLAGLARKQQELAEEQTVLIETLNDEDQLHGLFVGAMARRLRTLAGETERVKVAHEAQTDRVLDEARRLKQAERMVDRVSVDHRRETEKRDLQALVEALLARRRDASLP